MYQSKKKAKVFKNTKYIIIFERFYETLIVCSLIIFEKAIKNASPIVEVKARRIGGSNYQVPIEVNSYRAINLSLKWIILYSRQRVGRTMAIKLASEIIDAANDIGNTIKKKEETHRMAEANKAFAHLKY